MSEPVKYTVETSVATITLNMPDRKNSLSNELIVTLGDRLDDANGDPSVRAIVLTNTGNTFCAGADLKASSPGVPQTDVPNRTFVDIFNLITDGPKPVVGRIDGHATGGGVGLVASCDISIMRNDAKIGFTEVRLGVAPAVISVVCLPKMRRADAMELFLTGERFTPDRAQQLGLINRSVEAESLDDAVDEILAMVLKGGPLALTAAKNLVNQVPTMDRDAAFEWTSGHSQELFNSDEAQAGIAAFRERQPAPWAVDS